MSRKHVAFQPPPIPEYSAAPLDAGGEGGEGRGQKGGAVGDTKGGKEDGRKGSDSSSSTPQQQAPVKNMLQHFSYQCPGLHGEGSRQSIYEADLPSFFAPGRPQLVIPLFQRRYCWGNNIIKSWWMDVMGSGSKSIGVDGEVVVNTLANRKGFTGKHRIGKAVFKTLPDGRVCVIDGQQRLTTCLLMLAAVRDYAKSVGSEDVVRACEVHMYRDMTEWEAWREERQHAINKEGWKPLAKGDILPFSTLIPSFADRQPFFEHLVVGALDGAELSEDSKSSHQGSAYSHFSSELRRAVDAAVGKWRSGRGEAEKEKESEREGEECARKEALVALAQKALDGSTFMRVDIENDINYGQVFLWLQEKSLFSMAALLHNPTPGENFAAGDLVRNLFMSRFMGRDFAEQERVYEELWVKPIEEKCMHGSESGKEGEKGGRGEVGKEIEKVITRFLQLHPKPTEICSFEKQMNMLATTGPSLFRPSSSMIVYAKFVSYFEAKLAPFAENEEEMVEKMKEMLVELAEVCERR
eukprot:CAMPEP_0113910244 /NCGR_PEP_ID=MMETSP0780_2-20120614/27404_1 /TAXON_ID=652834 /ORGANISM="Palpitomonas bilix" /LENGTH=523 /DNA_ID=CAMNT_0000906351 /DNA_START=119 /DNA_END=1690 /DNA_ORIENTATION=- /assembly_acc=CAM_ASM_000599